MNRRQVLALAAGLGAGGLSACASMGDTGGAETALQALEAKAGGRLGVAIYPFGARRAFGWRIDERFGMASTFKLALAGLILAEADAGRLSLDQFVPYTEKDIVAHAPVTKPGLAQGGLSVRALAEGTQKTSDNPAANLLLAKIGGPEGFTARLRALGDGATRLDRLEPAMNFGPPGEVRDTTTPAAMARTAAALLAGDVLKPASRALLAQWTVETETGLQRLRAGFPKGLKAGDKTGTAIAAGMANKINDVAMVWPEGRAPIAIAAYYEAPSTDQPVTPAEQAVLAEAGRIAAAALGLTT